MKMDICKMTIVLPAAATVAEQGAAEELREHIEKMCGVNLPVVLETEIPAENKAIYIGATQYATSNHVTFPDNAFGEGWAIKAVDGNLVLCGGKVRGVLYAVYHLLEDVLGVRWWSIWEEFIPTRSAALVPGDYEDSGVPAMEYRDVFAWVTETDSRFFVRNRLNGFMAYAPAKLGGKEDFGEPAHIHTFDRYFPEKYTPGAGPEDVSAKWADALNPEKENYFETHPEWFALTGRNKRVPRIFCLSNEDFQKTFAEKLCRSIAYSYEKADQEGKARPRYFDVSPADMFGECACPRCRASIKAHGSSGHQLLFVNKMAEAVEKIYPEVIIDTPAYWHYIEPPKDDTKPRDNVAVRFADNYMDLLHDIHHKNNRDFLRRLSAWSKICKRGRFYIWDYGVNYGPNGVFPSMYKLGKNFKLFWELGANGYFLEMEHCIQTDFWDMKVWLSAKLMENPNLEMRSLMDTFIDGYYGAAAGKHIRAYLDRMHKIAEENPGFYRYGSSIIEGDGLTVEDILASNTDFEAATASAAGDETLLRRLKHARCGLDRVIVENYGRLSTEAGEKKLALPFDKATVGRRLAEAYAQQVALRGDWDYTGEESRKCYEKYLTDCESIQTPVEESEHLCLARINGCADAWKGPTPELVDEAVFSGYAEDKLSIFCAGTDFSTLSFCAKEDPDAPAGIACVFDLAAAKQSGIYRDEGIQQKWAVENNDPSKIIPIGIYTGKLDDEGAPISNLWGTLRARDIATDGKYHLYRFSDVSVVEPKPGTTFHIFRDWGLQIYTLPKELEDLRGKKLDFYLSMKVTGDVSCCDPENMPVYSVDRIIVAEK